MGSRFSALRAVFAFASLALLALPARVEAIPIVSVGSSATHVVGETFTIPISVSGATDLQAFQFDLSYNSSVLSALSFTDAGTDFDSAAAAGGGILTGIAGFSLSGLLSGVADSMIFVSTGLTGTGVLVNVEFEAIGAGTSTLTLSSVFLDFSDSGFTLANGEVQAPEPGTLALLAMGLGLLTRRRLTSTR